MFTKHFTIEDYDRRNAGAGSGKYHTRKMFPDENNHYRKNIRVIGGIDLNPEKFTSEYKKRYFDRGYSENLKKNTPYFLTALAARQYKRYMEMVHGQDRS